MKYSIVFLSSIFFGADVYLRDGALLLIALRSVKKHLKTTLDCNSGGGLIIKDVGGEYKCYLTDIESLDDTSAALAEFDDPLKTFLSEADIVAANGIVCVSRYQTDDMFQLHPSTRKVRKYPMHHLSFRLLLTCLTGVLVMTM